MLPLDPIGRELWLMILRDQHERWLMGSVEGLIDAAFRDVATTLVTKYGNLTAAKRTKLYQLFDELLTVMESHYVGTVDPFLSETLTAFADAESTQAANYVNVVVERGGKVSLTLPRLSPERTKAIAAYPVEGLPTSDWLVKMGDDAGTMARQQIQIGLLAHESTTDIVRRLISLDDTSTTQTIARNRARTLVRTAFTSTYNQTAVETYSQDDRVSDKYRYVAIRDKRTSAICRALDGNEYLYTDPDRKMPPQHPNCRSSIVPIVKFDVLGLAGMRNDTTFTWGSYSGWLSGQSTLDQDQILGKTAAGLFREGRASLADLVAADGRKLTTAQLKYAYGL